MNKGENQAIFANVQNGFFFTSINSKNDWYSIVDKVFQTGYNIYTTRIIGNYQFVLVGAEKGLFVCNLTKDIEGNFIDPTLVSLSDSINYPILDIWKIGRASCRERV